MLRHFIQTVCYPIAERSCTCLSASVILDLIIFSPFGNERNNETMYFLKPTGKQHLPLHPMLPSALVELFLAWVISQEGTCQSPRCNSVD